MLITITLRIGRKPPAHRQSLLTASSTLPPLPFPSTSSPPQATGAEEDPGATISVSSAYLLAPAVEPKTANLTR